MWNRKDVKAKGKSKMKANFWKCVATALLLAIIGGGTYYGAGVSPAASGFTDHSIRIEQNEENDDYGRLAVNVHIEGQDEDLTADPAESLGDNEIGTDESTEELLNVTFNDEEYEFTEFQMGTAFIVISVIAAVATLIIVAVGLAAQAFILNPIELGCRRFFRKNLDEPAKLSNITYGFDNNYKSNVKTMFLRTLYTLLWTMLFIIPGIVKSYEYRLIPYILSENPEMSTEEVFALSKKLMTGNKWKAFVFDLSFLGWQILSAFTCGILGIFYVEPYKASADAALYEAIRYGA